MNLTIQQHFGSTLNMISFAPTESAQQAERASIPASQTKTNTVIQFRGAVLLEAVPEPDPFWGELSSKFPGLDAAMPAARARLAGSLFRGEDSIRQLRLERGLSQEEFAKQMETAQSAISRLEAGKGNPSYDFLLRAAEILKSNIGEIAGRFHRTKQYYAKAKKNEE